MARIWRKKRIKIEKIEDTGISEKGFLRGYIGK